VHTNERVRDLVRDNIGRSPLYNGQIKGVGPRYCPSLEDKIMRFPDKERHQIFLEPEGRDVDEIYVNGLSMSLPRQVRTKSCTPCLDSRRHRVHGTHAVVRLHQPTELDRSSAAAARAVSRWGEINGTSGYEEAAAQG
jgi:tRNA uridine 5-carboxymethylaminomethyl modification enzyme